MREKPKSFGDAADTSSPPEKSPRQMVMALLGLLAVAILIFLCLFMAVGIFSVRSDRIRRADVERLHSLILRMNSLSAAQSNRAEVLSRQLTELGGRTAAIEARIVDMARGEDARTVAMERIAAELRTVDAGGAKRIDDLVSRVVELESAVIEKSQPARTVARLPSPPPRTIAAAEEPRPAPRVAPAPGAPPASSRKDQESELRSTLEKAIGTVWANLVDENTNSYSVVPPLGSAGTIRPEGATIIRYANGDRFEGELKAGRRNGWGVMRYANGDRYEGQFRDDVRDGSGMLFFAKGDQYTGAFVADRFQGKGLLRYSNGNLYMGFFENGLRSGSGVLFFANGDVYRGDFKQDKRSGRGMYVFKNGVKYEGEFLDGQREGVGRLTYPGGEVFIGEFRKGVREGRGVLLHPDGQVIEGTWKRDGLIGESAAAKPQGTSDGVML